MNKLILGDNLEIMRKMDEFDSSDDSQSSDESGRTHKFKPGAHIIAVKAIDNEGLEAVEVIKVKVNGELEVGK